MSPRPIIILFAQILYYIFQRNSWKKQRYENVCRFEIEVSFKWINYNYILISFVSFGVHETHDVPSCSIFSTNLHVETYVQRQNCQTTTSFITNKHLQNPPPDTGNILNFRSNLYKRHRHSKTSSSTSFLFRHRFRFVDRKKSCRSLAPFLSYNKEDRRHGDGS